jgi:hypothetical protein
MSRLGALVPLWFHEFVSYRVALAILLVCSSITIGYDIRVDLSGTWVPDSAKSTMNKHLKTTPSTNLPAAPPPPPEGSIYPSEKIEQQGTTITISTLGSDGKVMSTIILSADGEEKVNQMAEGAIQHRSVTLWEGNKLVTTWKMERDGKVFMEGKDIRELSDDEKVQNLQKHMQDSKSVTDMTIVLVKQ